MVYIFYLVLLLLSLSLQAEVTILPIAFVVLLVWTIEKKSILPLFLTLVIGLFLDIVFLRILGSTSMYFLLILLLVFLYEKKFEVASIPFIVLVSFFATFFYFAIFFQLFLPFQAVVCAGFALILFLGMRYFSIPKKKTYSSLL